MPPSDEIIYTDEVVRPFELGRDVKDVGLVGISVDSKTARRSYDIADAYRRRGVRVVLGGIHPTACPEEARSHADAVVVGEAEDVWPRLLEDAKARRLAPLYRPSLPDLAGKPFARRDLFRSRRYIPFQVLQTSAAVRTRASSAAFRPRTAPRCASVPRTRCSPSSGRWAR